MCVRLKKWIKYLLVTCITAAAKYKTKSNLKMYGWFNFTIQVAAIHYDQKGKVTEGGRGTQCISVSNRDSGVLSPDHFILLVCQGPSPSFTLFRMDFLTTISLIIATTEVRSPNLHHGSSKIHQVYNQN